MALQYRECTFNTLARALMRGGGVSLANIQRILERDDADEDAVIHHDGYPALHYACEFDNSLDVVQYIYNKDPHAIAARDLTGKIPLQYAIGNDSDHALKVLKFLLEHHLHETENDDQMIHVTGSQLINVCIMRKERSTREQHRLQQTTTTRRSWWWTGAWKRSRRTRPYPRF